MTKAIGYQPHIDGLRALAVLPILLFHARVPGFSGGFVGVDIFFVISGYLITRILKREIDTGHFSILRFYERRARRILPALTVMLVAVLAAAAILYLPGDFDSVPRSALATALFVSNLYFFTQVGYFDVAADTKPLLHSWSLGIEEQFYLGFPVLLLMIARWMPRRRRLGIAIVAAISFAWALVLQGDRSGFAFYLLPPRAWELLAGALLALANVPQRETGWRRESLSAVGLIALAASVFGYDSHTPFPGATALVPVLGAAALIQGGCATRVGRILSWQPLSAIGLISYSLYLWHWPLIVFTEYALDRHLAGWTSVAVILAALAAATLSWRFVEAPFRDPLRVSRRAIFWSGGSATALVSLLSLGMIALHGWPQRFPPEVAQMAAAKDDVSPMRERCHDTASTGRMPCTLGAPGVAPTALVWGDSHGVELAYALSRIAAARGRALVERTQSSCPPLLETVPSVDKACASTDRATFDAVLKDRRLRTIYLIGFWASPAYAQAEPGLNALIARLVEDGRQVVLIGPVPANRFDVPRRLARLARAGRLADAQGVERAAFADAETRLRRVAETWRGAGVRFLEPAAALCDDRRCAILADRTPLYFDHHHLSLSGATRLVRRWDAERPLPFD